MHSTCSSFLNADIYFTYMQCFKRISLTQRLPLSYKLLLFVMNSNAHFSFCFEISNHSWLSFLSGFEILESFPQAAIAADKRVWNSVHKEVARSCVRELPLVSPVQANKRRKPAPIGLNSRSKQDKHWFSKTVPNLRHLGVCFTSGDQVLYVQLRANHQGRSHTRRGAAC